MSDFFFLPAWPIDGAAFPWFALLLLAALLIGESVQRWLHLPRMLGWIACGLIAGPGLGLLEPGPLAGLRWLLDIAMGLVLFELGQRVDYGWLKRNPWLLATSVAESALAFALMFGVLLLLDVNPLLAAIAAAIGVATSPAVVLTLAKEQRAQGQVTERILLLSALNCIYAFVAVNILFAWQHAEYRGGWITILAHPLYLIFGSLFAAALLATASLWLLERLARRPGAQFICVFALVLLAVTGAAALKLSVALTLLAFAAFTRMFDRHRRFAAFESGRVGRIAVILLFALTAASIDPRMLQAGALAGAALLAARWFGKAAGVLAFGRLSGISLRKASLVSLGLVPMSGLALLLVHDASNLYPQLGPQLGAIMLATVVMLEVLGPLIVHFALTRAGEADPAEEG